MKFPDWTESKASIEQLFSVGLISEEDRKVLVERLLNKIMDDVKGEGNENQNQISC